MTWRPSWRIAIVLVSLSLWLASPLRADERGDLQNRLSVLEAAVQSAEQRLAERRERLGEWDATLRLLAEDSSKLLAESLIGLQVPADRALLEGLRKGDNGADLAGPDRLVQRLVLEIEGQARIERFESPLVDLDGRQHRVEVTRVGPFVALHQGRYLEYVPELQRLRVLDRQPAARFLQANGREFTDGVRTYAIDPGRGALLALLVQSPSLEERLHQGGLVGYLILLLAAVGLLLALARILGLRRVASRVAWQLRHPDQPRATNPLGRVLLAVDARETDIELIERRLDEAILKEMPALERGLSLIRLFAAIAPLLGLLGTVVGMILTFQAISLFGSGDPKLMAGGISQALVTTVMGLSAAIPLLLLHSLAAASSRRVEQVLEEQAAALVAQRLEQAEGVAGA